MSDPADTRRWQRADELFSAALELPPAARRDFVRRRCASDSDLLRDVESLLDAEMAAWTLSGDYADGSIGAALSDALDEAEEVRDAGDPRIGARIGAYRLIRRLGRGGMADVYLGERDDGAFRGRVAVKIQRRGLDTDDLVRRFRAERQILSQLDHPNIARLLDGGTTRDGLPFLVMEYVEGRPITGYCDAHELSVRARLELFVQAVRAVQSAHARLVVHRDIKPSNIFVSDDGIVKLLDFGIAKLLDPAAWPEDSPRTRTGFRPLTPEYASPEQVLGAPITVASDIYQLGLVLYRLLTGGRPYETTATNRRALEQAITETRPARPSEYVESQDEIARAGVDRRALVHRLRGDLDTIVLTALRKEPDRRYPSAHELAEDLRRTVEGRPIWARRDSRAYRLRKFLGRNPWVAPSAAAAAGIAALYVGTLVRHGHQLEAERNAARVEAAKAKASQEFLVGLFRSADPFAPASGDPDVRVGEVMEAGAQRARAELADQPELQAVMLGTIGEVFLGLGEPEKAVELSREAWQTARATFGPRSPQAVVALREMIEPTIYATRGKAVPADSAVRIALRALNDARAAFGPTHVETGRTEVAAAEAMLFGGLGQSGAILARHALPMLSEASGGTPVDRARGLMVLTRSLAAFGYWDETRVAGREAVAAFEAAYGPDHLRTWAMRLWLSRVLDPADGDPLRAAAIQAFETRLGPLHEQTIRAHVNDATILNQRGDYAAATRAYRTVVDRRLARGETNWIYPYWRSLGDAAQAAGEYPEAEEAYREAVDAAAATGESRALVMARLRARHAWALLSLGRTGEALGEITAVRRSLAGQPADAIVECVAARTLRAAGRSAEAEEAVVAAAERISASGYVVRDYHPCWGLLPAS
ncbi:MAG: serine/threonine-protein kinase [Gemmatimonadales bacterium]